MINENIKRLIIIFIITITLPLQKIVHAQLFYNDQQIISGESYDNVKLPNLEYIESNVDLRVKVLGGEVKLNRSWVNGRWYANPAWANLRFILDPLDNSVKTIDRAGTMYQRVNNDQLFTYETVAIKKNESGWQWFDQQGNWINFDDKGRLLEYGDANNVKVSFVLDDEGRRIAINDHFGELVYRFTYNDQENLVQVTDREGRTVYYEWSDNKLVKVIDVMGNEWFYGYDANGQLNQKTSPDGNFIKIDYTVSTPAPLTAMTSCKEGAVISQNPVVTTGSINRDTKLAQVGKIIEKNGAVTIYNRHYNRINKQFSITITAANGEKITTEYDSKGRKLKQTINDNLTEFYQRETLNNEVKFTNERGLNTTIQYNESNFPTKIVYPNGASEFYEYNKSNKLIKITNINGLVVTFDYDNLMRPKEIIFALGKPEQRKISFSYDNYGQQIAAIISDGNKTIELQKTFDRYGNIITYTDGKGYQSQYTYNIQGQIKTVKNYLQHFWQFNYNLAGYSTEIIDPLNHSTFLTTDFMGRLTKYIDALGHETLFSYSFTPDGYETKVTNPLNQTTTYQYDNLYHLIKTISPTGLEKQKIYNAEGEIIQDIDEVGNVIAYEYGTKGSDLAGLIAKIVLPTYSAVFSYNNTNNITEINQLLGENKTVTKHFVYDQMGSLTQIIDAASRLTQTDFNILGYPIKKIDALGGQTTFERDLLGNLNKIIDANENQYSYVYDENNNLIKETKSLGNEVEYFYNEIDQLVEQKNSNGNRVIYQYDKAGNNIKKSYLDKAQSIPSQEIYYSYNEANQLIEVQQTGDTNTHFIYLRDALGRVIQETISYGDGNDKITKTLKYSYDEEGNLISFNYPDNSSVNYQYDKNQLIQATLANGEIITWSNYQWLMPTRINYPSITQNNLYDPLLRILQINVSNNDKTLFKRDYVYDEVGNISQIETENGLINYQYDSLDRITMSKPSNEIQNLGVPIESYEYDLIGNRISSLQYSEEWIYNQFNQLTKLGDGENKTILTYTPNGQLASEVTSDKKWSYHYNAADRLISVKDENNEIASYQYDAFGRRISKMVNDEVTYFMYANEGLIAELNNNGELIVAYGWVPNSEWGTHPLWYAKLAMNQTLQTATYNYLITDHLGTPQLAFNNQGQPTWKIYNDAFGNVILDPNNNITLNLRFPGQYYDQETGLFYNYFRDYNPKIGRYIQSDPIGISGGINTYIYANSNPLIYIDPNGKFGIPGAFWGAFINAGSQFAVNMYISRNIWVSLRCIQIQKVIVSAVLGAASPGLLQLFSSKCCEKGLSPTSVIIYQATATQPTGAVYKKILPNLRIGDDCECKDIDNHRFKEILDKLTIF